MRDLRARAGGGGGVGVLGGVDAVQMVVTAL